MEVKAVSYIVVENATEITNPCGRRLGTISENKNVFTRKTKTSLDLKD